jgi:VanZ family protein
VPASALPDTPAGSDKLEHWLVYAGLATAAVQLFPRPRALATSAVGLLALGIAIEFAQALLTTTRSGDVWDAAADALGILFGMATVLTPWRDLLLRFDRA